MLFLVGQGIFLLVGNGLGTHGKNGFVCLRKPQARRRNRRRRARTHSITHGRKNVNPFLEGPRKAAGELATKDFVDAKIHALELRLVRWIIRNGLCRRWPLVRCAPLHSGSVQFLSRQTVSALRKIQTGAVARYFGQAYGKLHILVAVSSQGAFLDDNHPVRLVPAFAVRPGYKRSRRRSCRSVS